MRRPLPLTALLIGLGSAAHAQSPASAPNVPAGGASGPAAAGAGAPGAAAPGAPATSASGAAATSAPSPGGSGVPSAAARVLLDQAQFWTTQNQPDQAEGALQRLLRVEPDNPEALGLLAQLQAGRGDRARAQATLARLRAIRPGDPRIPAVEQSIRLGSIDPGALAEARRLAQEGRTADAIARYQRLFQGSTPPPSLAVEYYQTLSGTEGGWDAARRGLAQVVTGDPNDLRAQMAYAQLLTYREQTRTDGIQRLEALAQNPSIGAAADKAWRQALEWLPVDTQSIPAYQAWLVGHPGDGVISGKLEQARNPPRTPAAQAAQKRAAGFAALNAGKLAEAEADFNAALALNPEDADSMGGIGLVRLRQGNAAEARTYLARAITADPTHKDRWEQALQGANVGEDYAAARAAIQRGQLDSAERQLRAIIARGGDVAGAQSMLADVLSRRGDLAGAETQYRAVLGRQPSNPDALVGLAQVLNREGRSSEAEALLDRAQSTGATRVVGRIRADALRQQAAATTDPGAKEALLRAAVAADPADPWTRLDLARALAAAGRKTEAEQVMADVTSGPRPSTDALRAGALFASEIGNSAQAAALINRLPPAARTPDMRALLAQAALQGDIRTAMSMAAVSPAVAREKLLTLAAHPDPDGARGAAIARAFLQMRNPAGAREALATAQAATPKPTAAQRLAYAGVLLQAGDDRGARALIASLDGTPGLTADQTASLNRLRAGLAVREADTLNQERRQADAYDVLAPALARDPSNPDLNLAVGRLYSAADEPRKALAINDAVLARDPGNMDARRAALDAAIQANDWTRARALVREAMSVSPDDPRAWMLSAALNRARGNLRAAMDDLKRAQSLRRQEIGADQTASVMPVMASRQSYATVSVPVDANPFRRSGPTNTPSMDALPAGGFGAATVPTDPMLQDIDKQMASLREDLAPKLTLGPTYRNRTGTQGLDQLNEVSMPTTLLLRPWGQGTLTAEATPTFLSAGTLPLDANSQASFGTGAFGGKPTPGSQSAQGVGLSVAYQIGWAKLDVGTSPLGFQQQNLLGGLELSPALSDNVRLRVTGERRAVTDSLLSYAGTTDPSTGTKWGGVTRTRGHAQIEGSVQDANFYFGGGYALLEGTNVAQNHEYEFGAGGSYPIWRGQTDEVRLGVDVVYFAYDKNLRYFTLGQGGYFSPQSYFATLFPVRYTSKTDDLTWSIGGALGYQTYNEHSSPVFPNNPSLQSALVAQAASSSTTIQTSFPSKSASGLVGGAEGSIQYRVNNSLILGGEAHYQHAGDWSETVARLFARYIFDGDSW
ncbi:MAG: BCSC C-terminal domain-containing protein [Rhodospirillales bacterium]|nr:BCSC C-terminal domain-containing protein [Rhodospirillales bacterium]